MFLFLRYKDAAYTERFMDLDTADDNAEGYDVREVRLRI